MFKKVFLCFLISFLVCQCYNKRIISNPPKSQIPFKVKTIILHQGDFEKSMAVVQIDDEYMHGYFHHKNYKTTSPKLHLYLDPSFDFDKENSKFSLPLKELNLLEKSLKPEAAGALAGAIIGGLGMVIAIAATPEPDNSFEIISKGEAMAILAPSTAALGALVGAMFGSIASTDIKSNDLEKTNNEPAQKKSIKKSPSEPLRSPHKQKAKGGISKRPPQKSETKIHLSFGGMLKLTPANNDIFKTFKSSSYRGTEENWFWGPSYFPKDHTKHFSWNADLEYDLSRNFRLGMAINKFPNQEIVGKNKSRQNANGTTVSIFLEYVPVPLAPLYNNRSEFAIGAGLDYSTLSVYSTLHSSDDIGNHTNPTYFDVTEKRFGFYTRMTLDYYLSREFSLQGKVEGRLVPSIDIPKVSHTNPENNTISSVPQHQINFSSVDFSLGVRIHF